MTCFEKLIQNMYKKLEEKRREEIDHVIIKKSLERRDIAIFLISKKSVKNKKRYQECEYAFSLNKLMYVVIKNNVRWRKYKKFPWRKIYYYTDACELPCIMKEIISDANLVYRAGGP